MSPRTLRPGHAQTLAIMVIALPAFIGTIGLAADIGNYYFNYVKLQTAVDLSVLSGARYLPDQPCSAISTANIFVACFNRVAASEVVSTTSSGTQCLRAGSTPATSSCPALPAAPTGCSTPVPPSSAIAGCNLTMTVHRTVPFYFARMVGVNTVKISVSSTATAATAGSVLHGVPIGVQYRPGDPVHSANPVDGTAVLLVFRSPLTPGTNPNNWSTLALGGAQFTSTFPSGYSGKVSLNDAVAPDRSAITTGPVNAAIQARINIGVAADPSGSAVPPASYTASDVRAVTVALVDWGAPGGCCRIEGFAQLWIGSVSNANISGRWIANGVDGSLNLAAPNFGALAISLTQ